jgi:hypothetical protein
MGKAELKDFSVLPGAVPDKLKASVEPTSPGMKRIGAAKKVNTWRCDLPSFTAVNLDT